MRLIDADKMLLELDCGRMSCDVCPFLYGGQESGCAINDDEPIAKWIEAQPTVEAEPVRYGRWINKQGGFLGICECSVCHNKYPTAGWPPCYCPNCGAKMDGGDEHE